MAVAMALPDYFHTSHIARSRKISIAWQPKMQIVCATIIFVHGEMVKICDL